MRGDFMDEARRWEDVDKEMTRRYEENAASHCTLDPLVVWLVVEEYGEMNGVGIRGVFASETDARTHVAMHRFLKVEAHEVIPHNSPICVTSHIE